MAERNEQVLDRVRQELNRDPAQGSRKLYDMLKDTAPEVSESTLQQFHARYVLPIKRERAAARSASAGPRRQRGGRGGVAGRGRKAPAAQAGPAENDKPREEPKRPRRAPAAKPAEAQPVADRDRVRSVLMQFARDFSEAESRSDIVRVLSRIDDYVDQVAGGKS